MALVGKKTTRADERPSPLMPKLNPLSDPHVRLLVRMAAVEGDYGAVKEVYALAKGLVPEGADLWAWWLDGVEGLVQARDPDGAMFVQFTGGVAGIKPWGDLRPADRDRLKELSLLP
ncbi:MAG: hypothetical protein ACP5VR_11070 [Acidimicrobiales bacterium]